MSRLLLLFSAALAVFIILPAFLGQPFFAYALMKRGDIVDLFTPIVLLPLYYLLLAGAGPGTPGRRETIVFLVLGALWVEGQAIHLAANSIAHHLRIANNAGNLAYLYDEHLSHYVWHFALSALAIMIVAREERGGGSGGRTPWPGLVIAAVIYGITFFILTVEGQTATLGIPFALVLVALLWRGRRMLAERPLLAFFGIGYGVGLILMAGWALYWQGLPEFSKLGII